jgi:hypothetical protein
MTKEEMIDATNIYLMENSNVDEDEEEIIYCAIGMYGSTEFRCPDTGWGVKFVYDEDSKELFLRSCLDGAWNCSDGSLFEIIEKTDVWCENQGVLSIETLEEANKIAETYGCCFQELFE